MTIIKVMFGEGQIQHVLFTAVRDLQTTPNATHLSNLPLDYSTNNKF